MPLGEDLVLRVGRYGPYVESTVRVDGEDPRRATVPDDIAPDELTPAKARELLAATADDGRVLGTDPVTGREIIARAGRYGPYVTEVIPAPEDPPAAAVAADGPDGGAGDGGEGAVKVKPKKKAAKKAAAAKPRTGSLFADMSLDTITLDDALRLLSLPRVVGVDPESGDEITAQNGRYGPYLRKGTDSRSLEREDQLFTVTLEEALAIYAQPKRRGRQAAAPLAELGADPVSGQPIVVKDGRFGPYVTDGETNATLRKGDEPESVTLERAAELLAEKRARGPAPKRRTAKKADQEDGREADHQEGRRQALRRRCRAGPVSPAKYPAQRGDPVVSERESDLGVGLGSVRPSGATTPDPDVKGVLAITPFRRLWLALGFSSFGDWLGLLAITAMADYLARGSTSGQYLAVAGVFILRLAPSVVLGPLAGALADRISRRWLLVYGDVLRFLILATVPFVGTLWWLYVATLLIECVGLFWLPAKDATMPNLVPRKRLEAANQLSLVATYGTAPVAALAFSGLVLLNGIIVHAFPHLGLDPKGSYLGIWIDSLSYLVSGLVIWRLDFPKSVNRIAAEQPLWRSIVEGWRFVGGTPLIRGAGRRHARRVRGRRPGHRAGPAVRRRPRRRPRGVRRAVRGRLLRPGRRHVARPPAAGRAVPAPAVRAGADLGRASGWCCSRWCPTS